MANIKSAIKRARQNTKRRNHNTSLRSAFRTYIKNVVKAIEAGDKKVAQECLTKAIPMIDKAVTKGLIHKNNAARNKSRLNAKVKAMA